MTWPASQPAIRRIELQSFGRRKRGLPVGRAKHDLFQDPGFVKFSTDWHEIADVRLKPTSPAVNSGKDLYPLPDGLVDSGPRDRGAIPLESKPWPVGIRGQP